MTGGELAKQIQANTKKKSVVILFSSIDWASIEDEAHGAEVYRFLPKPLFPSTIFDTISECIGSDSVADNLVHDVCSDDFSEYTILLAEDVDINREIVLTLLEPTNLTVDCAENGTQTVKMFETAPDKYSLIFMDVQMPEMDGYDATRAIRELDIPWGRDIPIIAMTANVFREDIDMCLEAGMNAHLGKPLDINEVLKVLRQYLTHCLPLD